MTIVTPAMKRRKSSTTPQEQRILRAVFYYRVSSDEQEERGTIEAQGIYLRDKFAADFREDAPPSMRMTFVGEYADNGVSGAIPFADRPAGARLLADARAGMFDVVIVYKVDRLGRVARVLLEAHGDLQDANVAIKSATEAFDTSPGPYQAFGIFTLTLLAGMSELERSTIRTRTMNGKVRVATEGRFINGAVPFGYRVDEHDALVPSERDVPALGTTEREVIVQIFERIAAGQSTYVVTDWLNEAGVPSTRRFYNKRQAHASEHDQPAGWSPRRIGDTIHNSVYRGLRVLSFDGNQVEQRVPALVSDKLWADANTRLSSKTGWDTRGDNFQYLLSRKLRCSMTLPDGTSCGLYYTGGLSGGVRYYTCNGNDSKTWRRRGARCGASSMQIARLEPAIWSDLQYQVDHADEVVAALEASVVTDVGSPILDRLAALRAQHDALAEVRRNLRQQRLRTGISKQRQQEIEEDLDINDGQIVRVDEQVAQLEANLTADGFYVDGLAAYKERLLGLRGQMQAIWASGDRGQMRQVLNDMVDSIDVLDSHPKRPRLRINYRFPETALVQHSANITAPVGEANSPASGDRLLVNITALLVASEEPAQHLRAIA